MMVSAGIAATVGALLYHSQQDKRPVTASASPLAVRFVEPAPTHEERLRSKIGRIVVDEFDRAVCDDAVMRAAFTQMAAQDHMTLEQFLALPRIRECKAMPMAVSMIFDRYRAKTQGGESALGLELLLHSPAQEQFRATVRQAIIHALHAAMDEAAQPQDDRVI